MIQLLSALLAGAFLLSSCGRRSYVNDAIDPSATHIMCVDSFNKETGDIALYFDTALKFVPKIQHISDVSALSIDESIANLGLCSDVIDESGSI